MSNSTTTARFHILSVVEGRSCVVDEVIITFYQQTKYHSIRRIQGRNEDSMKDVKTVFSNRISIIQKWYTL